MSNSPKRLITKGGEGSLSSPLLLLKDETNENVNSYKHLSQLDKDTLREINIENLKKNPMLFSIKTYKNTDNEINPLIMEKLRRMTLASSLSSDINIERKLNKKVNFLKFLKKPKEKDAKIDNNSRKLVLFGLIKDFCIEDLNNQNKGYNYKYKFRGR